MGAPTSNPSAMSFRMERSGMRNLHGLLLIIFFYPDHSEVTSQLMYLSFPALILIKTVSNETYYILIFN